MPEGQGGGEQLLDDFSALLSSAMMPTALQCSNSTNSENIIWIVQAKCALYTILCLLQHTAPQTIYVTFNSFNADFEAILGLLNIEAALSSPNCLPDENFIIKAIL